METMSEFRGDREFHDGGMQELNDLSKDMEKIVDVMENVSVHLAWMAYDMVVLRGSPEVRDSIGKLEDEFLRCKTLIESTCMEAMGSSAK